MADLAPLRTCSNEAEFNAFLVQIADEITKDELLEMRFLCLNLESNLSRGPLEAIEEPREFVNFLRRRDIISPGNVGFLMWLLDSTGNKRLANMVRERGKQTFQFTIITCAFNGLGTRWIFCSVDHAQSMKRSLCNIYTHIQQPAREISCHRKFQILTEFVWDQ